MRPDEIAEQVFDFYFTQQPDANGRVKLNDLFRRLGVTQLDQIHNSYRILEQWFSIDPLHGGFLYMETKKYDRSVSPPWKFMAPATTLDNTSFHIQSTPAGREEYARRLKERHEREYIAKQNSTFDDVMTLARVGSEAAKLSAQAAIDAIAQQRQSSRTSNWVAGISAVIALGALFWTIGHDRYEDRQGSGSQELLISLLLERDSAARASSRPTLDGSEMPATSEGVLVICGRCSNDSLPQ